MPDDKVQREIEEILNRLDEFVPEKRPARRRTRTPHVSASPGDAVLARIASVSLKHVMLAALGLIVIAFFSMAVNPALGRWVGIAGLILFGTALVLSFFNKGTPTVEKRWRGQPMDLRSPSLGDRLRAWFDAKRRPR